MNAPGKEQCLEKYQSQAMDLSNAKMNAVENNILSHDNSSCAGMINEAVLRDLTFWRSDGWDNNAVQTLKSKVDSWVSSALSAIADEMSEIVGPELGPCLVSIVQSKLIFFSGLETESKELAQLKTLGKEGMNPVLQPLERRLGPVKNDLAYALNISRWLELLCNYRPECFSRILAVSEYWKTGALLQVPAEYKDICHGSVFRKSCFARAATSNEVDDLRVTLIMGYDDLELNNPLGMTAGKNNAAMYYVTIGNLHAEVRFQHEHMAPLMAVLERIQKRAGVMRTFSGFDASTGEPFEGDWNAPGAQLRTLVDGDPIQVCG